MFLLRLFPDKTKIHHWKFHKNVLRLFSFQLKNSSRWDILSRFSAVHGKFKHDCVISENSAKKTCWKKIWLFSTFLVDFLSLNFNSQSDFILISTTFFSMASCNKATREIYPEFSDCAIWNLFEFYQLDVSPQQFPPPQNVEAVVQTCSERLNKVK